MTDVDTLEHRIEAAWLRLVGQHRTRLVTLYLTRAGQITGWNGETPDDAEEIGSFTGSCALAALREDVFFAWDQMTKGRAA